MQDVANRLVSVSATSSQVCNLASRLFRRTQLIITNTSAAANVTITKGSAAAILQTGIVLTPNSSYWEADDGGYKCWQKEIQAIASAAGQLSIVESFSDEPYGAK